MKITAGVLEGCFVIEPTILSDDRGHFMETFNEHTFQTQTGVRAHFVQDNQSYSYKGVLRGLHYQTGEHAQAKLVRVLRGEVLDVAVDIRPGSKSFGQYASILLTGDNQKQFYIPRGFAHGFVVISDSAVFVYKCDNFYNRESEGGIKYDDPNIGIKWEFDGDLLISEKDLQLPNLENARKAW